MPADVKDQLRGKRVAVTGASGFIGKRLVQCLHAAGAEVVAITVAGRPTAPLDDFSFLRERLVCPDIAQIGETVRAAGAAHIVHLAAFVSTRRDAISLTESTRWNVTGTLSLLTACAEMGVARVVMMGSCEEYGQNTVPFLTSAAPDPLSPYGASKAAATAYARMFHSSFGVPTVVLRPSVVYGPGQSPRMLISQVMHALSEGKPIAVTPGAQTRDFVYVDDVVDHIVDALVLDGITGNSWNIASGEVVTVRECLHRIERIVAADGLTDRDGLIEYGARPYPDREIFNYQLEMSQTYLHFGWRPHVSLDDGLRRTWDSIARGVSA